MIMLYVLPGSLHAIERRFFNGLARTLNGVWPRLEQDLAGNLTRIGSRLGKDLAKI